MPTFDKPEDARDPLTVLLLKAVPPNERGNKTLLHLSKLLNVSKWGLRKWINSGKIGPDRALQIVEISKIKTYGKDAKPILGKPRVTIEDFHPYVYKD